MDIIEKDSLSTTADGEDEDGKRVRFESIINFPHFLLHSLKVFASNELDKNSYKIPELLDDKNLLDTFNSVINNGKQNGNQIGKKIFL